MSSKISPSEVEFQFRPIGVWNHGTGPRRLTSPFRVGAGRTQGDLKSEIAAVGVIHAVIQADLDLSDIRLDGVPRANARYLTGRVIVSFDHPRLGPLSMPCWEFADLWDNLRAVAKTLEALRAVDRYGVTQRAEQYRGWSQLPPARAAIVPSQWSSPVEAARFLIQTAQVNFTDIDARSAARDAVDLRAVYHAAAAKAHPDAGGSEQLMRTVNAAREMISQQQ